MSRVKEKEEFLLEQATAFDFASWKAQLVPSANPPVDLEVRASINDLIRLQEAEMEASGSDESSPLVGQSRIANSHTHATFEVVMASPQSETPPGGLTKIENFLTEDHETRLIDFFAKLNWVTIGNRAVCQYGFTMTLKKGISVHGYPFLMS